MKHTTEYLFGVGREEFEPEQSNLAKRKIKAAKNLMQKLSTEKNFCTAEKLPALSVRYQAAEAARKHWQDILHEPF